MNSEQMHHNQAEQMATKIQLISEENNVLTENTDLTFSGPNSPPVNKQKKVKKPTRQWAAWTRQEEENFFNALRQVGKNFEKITFRVQSKNKDQVRHYYYRLVRRMKKILGPNYCLDAKNSKDTIAAMLRWWSLLEKYSCTASKLHLKPRRFKIFVEALESQLIKDQKKSRRKRQQGDLFNTSSSSGNINNINNNHNNNNELGPVKLVPVENGQQTGTKLPPKGSNNNKRINTDGNLNLKIGTNKPDLSANRTVKQKRKNGAAYKKWEKAAMAGVSLVADAAEQLERANLNNDHNSTYCNNTKEANSQPLMKLKLQLFPINEATRKALERDSHNPHLELTLSGRKRIASVLEHLNKKWGNCDVTCGELLLVPYNADLATCQKWSVRDHVVVSDVFAFVGSPSVFRLRYGWFMNTETGSSFCNNGLITQGVQTGKNNVFEQNFRQRKGVQCAIEQVGGNQENYTGFFNGDNSAKAWADSLTDISVGYLLSEASRAANNNNNNKNNNNNNDDDNNCNNLDCVESCLNERAPRFEEEMGHSSDSFDEAIAAHLSNNKNNKNNCSNNNNNNNNISVSIWSAEETCDGFAFNAGAKEINKIGSSGSPKFKGILKDLCRNVASNENESSVKEIEKVDLPSDQNNESPKKDTYITDINWPDSLGPLDLDTPSIKYQISDVGFSDSFNSLTRMMQNSWDAFRSLSFLGSSEN